MARAIDGDALFCKFWSLADPYVKQEKVYPSQVWNQAATIAREAPTLTPANEWVSVEERSPENNAQVLMWSAKWNIAEAGSYYNERFWVYSEIGDAYIADDITHWMSLPAPPDRRPPEGEENA